MAALQRFFIRDQKEKDVIYLKKNDSEDFFSWMYKEEKDVINLKKKDSDLFFSWMDELEVADSWEDDYSVLVCDGSAWKIELTYDDLSNKTIRGTIEKPPYGEELERKIYALIQTDNQFLL